ncbi:unnamed protein product [Rotaria sp. Silwood2]|nr:unnamed protein product [Rotaria sp. Silwood2]
MVHNLTNDRLFLMKSLSTQDQQYERELYSTRWSNVRQGVLYGVFIGWLSLMTYLVYAVGFIFSSLLMSSKDDHRVNITDILIIVPIFAQCMGMFNYMIPFFQSFSEARGAAAEVFRLIEEGNNVDVNEKVVWKEYTESFYNIDGDIEFDNVNFTYPSRKDASVLRNLSFIARAGQTTALVGSNGSGKSTCISLFLRYYEPSSGQIRISGQQLTDYNVQQLRQSIGVVNQEPILFGISIYENIRFGKVNATRAEIEQAARDANAHNFIMQLPNKYETLAGERGIQLSGGEKQRIALARALVKQPKFLLLDEATSALDNISERLVQEALDRACKGRTTIVIAHRLTTIQNAHQIYLLDNGSVIEQGTHKTLMAKQGACVLNGAAQPMFAVLLAKTVDYTAFAISGSQLTQRIRSKAFACLLRQEVAYFDRSDNNSGAIYNRLSSDASAIQEMTGTRLGAICEALSMMFFGLLLGSFISWQLTLIAVGPLFIIAIVTYTDVRVRLWMNHQSNQIVERACTVRSNRIASSLSAAKMFFDLFERIPTIDNSSTEGQELIDFRGEIKFDNVKFIYPTRPTSIILNQFQLDIKPSQRVALVGTSGCGKSTIIQLLERFYDTTSGQILLDGVDIRLLNIHWLRSHFGLVSQEPVLFDLTIAENIAYGLENVPMEHIINAARKANIHQFIDRLPQGYETKVGLKGSFLSGGEKQRIAIARILLRRPKVLLLDEATSAMDSHNEELVQEALEETITEDPSCASLIIAHRLSTIRSSDLICVLDAGHIVDSGTHTELIQKRAAYYKLLVQENLQ